MGFTYITKGTGTRSNANPKTFTYTTAAATSLLVLQLVIDGSTDRTGGDPTFNGDAMTQAGTNYKAASSPETIVEQWYLIGPDIGSTLEISIPNSGTVYISAVAATFSVPAGSVVSLKGTGGATGTGTNPTGPTHSSLIPDDLIIGVLGSGGDSTVSPALTESDTLLYEVDDGTYSRSHQYKDNMTDAATSDALSWTTSADEDWAIASAVFTQLVDSANLELSKAVGYAVLSVPDGPNIAKAVGYAVLAPVEEEQAGGVVCFVTC